MTDSPDVSIALGHLLRGPLYAEDQPAAWATVTSKAAQLRDHLNVFGLRLVVNDVENYAYLRTLDELPEGMPRLVRRHSLTFGATVLLILLRRHLTTAESDATAIRVVVTAAEMVEWLTLYYPEGTSPDKIAQDITGLDRLGYVRRLRGQEDTFEIRRIIKSVVTADWIAEYGARLLDDARTKNNPSGAATPASDSDDPNRGDAPITAASGHLGGER